MLKSKTELAGGAADAWGLTGLQSEDFEQSHYALLAFYVPLSIIIIFPSLSELLNCLYVSL